MLSFGLLGCVTIADVKYPGAMMLMNQLHGYTGLVSRAIHLACEDNFTSTLSLYAEVLSSNFFFMRCEHSKRLLYFD